MTLNDSVQTLPLVGPSKAQLLEKLEIRSIKDLLFHIPNKYRDTSSFVKISELKATGEGTIVGNVEKIENIYTRTRKVLTRAKVTDDTGSITIVWFNQPYLVKSIQQGNTYIFEGKLSQKSNNLSSPTYELFNEGLEQTHLGIITPYYPETDGVSSKWLRGRINYLKNKLDTLFEESLPSEILSTYQLLPISEAIYKIHFPNSFEDVSKARERLEFDEMLGVSIEIEENVQKRKENNSKSINSVKSLMQLLDKLPYKLTKDQEEAISNIFTDIKDTKPMYRLLNGDVGSGKTVVAACAMYQAYQNGFSSVLLAPTTILATQHFNTLQNIFSGLNINIKLRISNKKIERNESPMILIGTHAILYDNEVIPNLALVVVDEQHRFGVNQREQLLNQKFNNYSPHYLMMSATPIPQTLTNILFGDMDVSFIREMPSGRIPVKTHFVPFQKRTDCYEWTKEEILKSNRQKQAFVIFPIIEESEVLELKAAKKEFEELKKGILSQLNVGILHGKMKASEKESILNDFKAKKIDVLVSTTVVEVGIDIPDATIMIIEDAQRFGLAQLHQLRGRVGRGKIQSFCFVIAGEKQEESSIERLKYFSSHNSGFDVAEYDLEKRGPGEVYGTKQTGIPDFKVASINNLELLIKTRKTAKEILNSMDLLNIKSLLFN